MIICLIIVIQSFAMQQKYGPNSLFKAVKEKKQEEVSSTQRLLQDPGGLLASVVENIANAFNQETDHPLINEARERVLFPHMQVLLKYYEPRASSESLSSLHLGNLLFCLGNVSLGTLGKPQEAKLYYEKALKIEETHYGEGHWQTAITLENLANAWGDLGDVKQKKTLLEKALKIFEAHYGEGHWQTAITLYNLAITYGDLGDIKKKRELLQTALKINEAHYGLDHYQTGITLYSLAKTFDSEKNYATAYPLAERAYRIFSTTHPDPLPQRTQDAFDLLEKLRGLTKTESSLEEKKNKTALLVTQRQREGLHASPEAARAVARDIAPTPVVKKSSECLVM